MSGDCADESATFWDSLLRGEEQLPQDCTQYLRRTLESKCPHARTNEGNNPDMAEFLQEIRRQDVLCRQKVGPSLEEFHPCQPQPRDPLRRTRAITRIKSTRFFFSDSFPPLLSSVCLIYLTSRVEYFGIGCFGVGYPKVKHPGVRYFGVGYLEVICPN